jgi:hypothetical protein
MVIHCGASYKLYEDPQWITHTYPRHLSYRQEVYTCRHTTTIAGVRALPTHSPGAAATPRSRSGTGWRVPASERASMSDTNVQYRHTNTVCVLYICVLLASEYVRHKCTVSPYKHSICTVHLRVHIWRISQERFPVRHLIHTQLCVRVCLGILCIPQGRSTVDSHTVCMGSHSGSSMWIADCLLQNVPYIYSVIPQGAAGVLVPASSD